MKTGDKYLLRLMVIGLLLVGYAHYDAQKSCLSMKKTKTDSTPPLAYSPFTGDYERINGRLFCIDSRGSSYRYPDLLNKNNLESE